MTVSIQNAAVMARRVYSGFVVIIRSVLPAASFSFTDNGSFMKLTEPLAVLYRHCRVADPPLFARLL